MTDEAVPADLREFIAKYIDSVAELEALLLLRNNPNERWDIANVAKRLYTTEHMVDSALTRLCEQGILTQKDGLYRFEPQSPDLEKLIDRLSDSYRRQLIPITNLIHAKPRRIREFADAFKLKKDD